MTVAQCLDYWFDNYVSTTLREKTQALYRSTVMKRMHDAFPNRPASSITVKQWVDLLTEEERDNPRRARQVLSQLRSAISWCMRRQLIDSCAIMSIQPRDFGSRAEVGDRVLSYHELAKIWLAIERSRASTSNKLLHQMLMLWGARLSELRLAKKTEFDLLENVWTVPKEHSKMGNVIRRPIFEQIKPFLEKAMTTYNDVLFPGEDINKPISIAAANRFVNRIRGGMDLGYWRTHDFRRTLVICAWLNETAASIPLLAFCSSSTRSCLLVLPYLISNKWFACNKKPVLDGLITISFWGFVDGRD